VVTLLYNDLASEVDLIEHLGVVAAFMMLSKCLIHSLQ
jgi:hypothetical protein